MKTVNRISKVWTYPAKNTIKQELSRNNAEPQAQATVIYTDAWATICKHYSMKQANLRLTGLEKW